MEKGKYFWGRRKVFAHFGRKTRKALERKDHGRFLLVIGKKKKKV